MNKIKLYMELISDTLLTVVDGWELVVFEGKLHRSVCWLITIALLPLNIIITMIWYLFDKDAVYKEGEEIIKEVSEARSKTE